MALVGHAPSLFLRGCSGKPCFIGKVFQKDCVTGLTLSGTGKTYTAFQIVYRLLTSGVKRKILYLADRNNLVDQSIQQDFSPLEKVIHKVNFAKDKKDTITALYICQHCGTKYTSEEAKKTVWES